MKETTNAQGSQSLPQLLNELEKQVLETSLIKNGWNKAATARELGISRPGVHYLSQKHGLQKPEMIASVIPFDSGKNLSDNK